MSDTITVGDNAERLAENFLQTKGLSTLTRNFHCRFGEIDLIMRDKDTLVFVEVRYRSNSFFGGPLASVTATKRKRLLASAAMYLQKNPRYQRHNQRFDVIGVLGNLESATYSIDWVQNAIEAD